MARALALVLCLGMGAAAPEPTETPVRRSILNPGPDCVPSARYVAPPDVETKVDASAAGDGTDGAGTGLQVTPPDVIAFPFFVDPLPKGKGEPPPVPGRTAQERAGASLYLGDVDYDRAKGSVTLGGGELTPPSDPCR